MRPNAENPSLTTRDVFTGGQATVGPRSDPRVLLARFEASYADVFTIFGSCETLVPAVNPSNSRVQIEVAWRLGVAGFAAVIDAQNSFAATLGFDSCSVTAVWMGDANGSTYRVSVGAMRGKAPHAMPVYSQRFELVAGARTPRIAVPSFAKELYLTSVPPLAPQVIIDWYDDAVAGSAPRHEAIAVEGLKIPAMTGEDYVDVLNGGGVNRIFTIGWTIQL
jgi:hypothetical protein